MNTPSPWVERWMPSAPAEGLHLPLRMLDWACGSGRHAALAAARGWNVLAVDRAPALTGRPASGTVGGRIEVRTEDLETGQDWTFESERFAVIVVTAYLHRPSLPRLFALLAAEGRLIYETFMQGNEALGRPRRADFLLAPDELFERVRAAGLRCVAFEQGLREQPTRAVVQRVVATRTNGGYGALS